MGKKYILSYGPLIQKKINPKLSQLDFLQGRISATLGSESPHGVGQPCFYLLLTARGHNSGRAQLSTSSLFIYLESIEIHDALKDKSQTPGHAGAENGTHPLLFRFNVSVWFWQVKEATADMGRL